MINFIETANYDAMSEIATQIFIKEIKANSRINLGLATGSTPLGLYQRLIKANKAKDISFNSVKTFNLDEYCGIDETNEQSYICFMRKNLFDYIDINSLNINIPSCKASNLQLECELYDKKITEAGGIDLQLLGMGNNGHIGFNEPAAQLDPKTHIAQLDDKTIKANSRFFGSEDLVPKEAITVGIHAIMSAKKVVLLVSGVGKSEAFKILKKGMITTDWPVTFLLAHPNCTVVVDKQAI